MSDNIHQGHRQRMRAKLYTHGDRIFDTYELLEMLLYYVIPYKDTNPISKRLLERFGSLDGVLSAKKEELVLSDGIGNRAAGFISAVGEMGSLSPRSSFAEGKGRYDSIDSLGKLAVETFSGITDYATAYFFFDSKMRLIATEEGMRVDYSSAAIKAKDVVNFALHHRACIVVSAHLHPFGPLCATVGDMATNEHVRVGLSEIGVVLAQHLLVSGGEYKPLMIENVGMFRQDVSIMDFLMSRDSYARSFLGKTTEDCLGSDALLLCDALSYFITGEELYRTVCSIIEKFPTVEEIFTKEIEVIERECSVSRNTATFIRLVAYVTARRRTDFFTFGKKHTEEELKEFLRGLFYTRSNEALFMLALDKKGRYLSCEFVSEGTVNASEVTPRRLLELAMKAGAGTVVLAHNHPRGRAEASLDDVNSTAKLKLTLEYEGIDLDAHYIVAPDGCVNII